MERWFSIDHEARLIEMAERLDVMAKAVDGIPGVSARIAKLPNYAQLELQVTIDRALAGKDASQAYAELLEGEPRIRCGVVRGGDTLPLVAHTMLDGEDQVVADRLREALGA